MSWGDDFTLDGPPVITGGKADYVPEVAPHTVAVEPLTLDAEGWPMRPRLPDARYMAPKLLPATTAAEGDAGHRCLATPAMVTPAMVSSTDPAWQALVNGHQPRQDEYVFVYVLPNVLHVSLI